MDGAARGTDQMLISRAPHELQARSKDGYEMYVEVTLTASRERACRRSLCARPGTRCHRAGTHPRVREDPAPCRSGWGKSRADAGPERLLDDLLQEAVAIVGGDAATVYGWDDVPGGLVVVRNTVRTSGEYVPSAQGTVGRAAGERAPVIVNDYQREPGMVASTLRAGVRAAIAVPLLYEGRLLGALGVVTYSADKRFALQAFQVLELLAGVAASVLVGLERARLEGALLSARTSAHELATRWRGSSARPNFYARGSTPAPRTWRHAST